MTQIKKLIAGPIQGKQKKQDSLFQEIINQQLQQVKQESQNKPHTNTSPNTSQNVTNDINNQNQESVKQKTAIFIGVSSKSENQDEHKNDISQIWQGSRTALLNTQELQDGPTDMEIVEQGAEDTLVPSALSNVPKPSSQVQLQNNEHYSAQEQYSLQNIIYNVNNETFSDTQIHQLQKSLDQNKELEAHQGIYTQQSIFSVDPRALDKRIQGLKQSLFSQEPHELMQTTVSPDPALLKDILSRKSKKKEEESQKESFLEQKSSVDSQQKHQYQNRADQIVQQKKGPQRRNTSPEVQQRQTSRVPIQQVVPTKPITRSQVAINRQINVSNQHHKINQEQQQIDQDIGKSRQQKVISKVTRTLGVKPVVQDGQDKAILQLYQLQQQQFMKLLIMVSRQKKLQAAQKIFFKVFCLIQDQLQKVNEQNTQIHTYNTLYPLVSEYNELGHKYIETLKQLPNDYIVDKIQHYCDLNNYVGNKKIDYIKIGSEREAKKFANDCNNLLQQFTLDKATKQGNPDYEIDTINMLSSQNSDLHDIQEKILRVQQLQYELASLKNE